MSKNIKMNSMLASIKSALEEESKGSGLYNEILKTPPGTGTGNTFTVRLLPYTPQPSKTFFHHFKVGWNSFATGQWVGAISPSTFGERDPVLEERYRSYRIGSPAEKEKSNKIKRLEKWLVNVYVENDPVNPENNGKVKILQYGKQLQKIILDALEGEDASEFGYEKVFSLAPGGASLKVKVEPQGEYPTYTSSRFTTASKLNLTESQQKAILDSVFNLEEVNTRKSTEDLQKLLDEHYFCVASGTNDEVDDVVDVMPDAHAVSVAATTVSSDIDDDDLSDILKELDSQG